MRTNGWQGDPITVIESGGEFYILDGHHRIAAARRVGGFEIPYRTITEADLPRFGYRIILEVIEASGNAPPNRLR